MRYKFNDKPLSVTISYKKRELDVVYTPILWSFTSSIYYGAITPIIAVNEAYDCAAIYNNAKRELDIQLISLLFELKEIIYIIKEFFIRDLESAAIARMGL